MGDTRSEPAQTWDPASYAANARFVSDLGEPLLDLLRPVAGERVLDVGCGDGALTVRLIEAGCAVVGVDASEAQVLGARSRGIDARVFRVEELPFENEFDAAFSNAVLHWIRNQPAALTRVARALRPHGRFIGEFGGHACVDRIRRAIHAELAGRGVDASRYDPWFFPTADQYAALLGANGFVVESILVFPRPTPLPGEMAGWLRTFAQPFVEPIPEADREGFFAAVSEALRPFLFDAATGWFADYTRLRFRARKAA